MIWTTSRPTKPGWYWWRAHAKADPHLRCITYVLGRLCSDGLPVKRSPGEWSSEPIPEPEEPA